MSKVSFFFVVDGQKYEVMATLLAASIRMHHGLGVDIIAYSPESNIEAHSDTFVQMMKRYGVSRLPFDNSNPGWATNYPHGNKILACCEKRDTKWSIFLDTDIALTAPCLLDQICIENVVAAVPEGVPTWGRADEDWLPLYSHFDMPLPSEKIRLVRGRRIEMMPYFNGGLVAFSEIPGEIDNNVDIDNKRPWLDQVSLPVAIARSGAKMRVLDEFHNYSLFRRKLPLPEEVRVNHYHIPVNFRRNPGCQKVLQSVVSATPANEKNIVKLWLERFIRPN